MAGVCTDVASLVVAMDGEIETHQLGEVRLIVVAEHRSKVGGPVLIRIDAANLSVPVEVTVDGSGQWR